MPFGFLITWICLRNFLLWGISDLNWSALFTNLLHKSDYTTQYEIKCGSQQDNPLVISTLSNVNMHVIMTWMSCIHNGELTRTSEEHHQPHNTSFFRRGLEDLTLLLCGSLNFGALSRISDSHAISNFFVFSRFQTI